MADKTHIQWTDATWNPTTGCEKVSPGCAHCYAVKDAHRMAGNPNPKIAAANAGLTVVQRNGQLNWTGKVLCHPERLTIPLGWRKARRIFVDSQSDLFHPDIPFEFVDRVFAIMALCPQHVFQVLTKRPERMAEYFGDPHDRALEIGCAASNMLDGAWIWNEGRRWRRKIEQLINLSHGFTADSFQDEDCTEELADEDFLPLRNVWLGVSVEDQKAADERIPLLLECPAAVRFLSCEPLLEEVTLDAFLYGRTCGICADCSPLKACDVHGRQVDWVIVGGESGPGSRMCRREWIQQIVLECELANVPVFVKQLGACYEDGPNGVAGALARVPEEAAPLISRRLKDGKGADMEEWPEALHVQEFPNVPQEAAT